MAGLRTENEFLQDTIFEIEEARCDSPAPPWMNGRKPLKHHALILIPTGTRELLVNGSPSALARNNLYVFSPGVKLELRAESDPGSGIYSILFDLYRANGESDGHRSYARDLTFPLQGKQRLSGVNRFKRLCRIASEGEAVKGNLRFLGQQYLYDILNELLSHPAEEEENEDAKDRIDRTVGYMQRHYREDIRIEQLARLAKLHPTYYSELFKQIMNQTPRSYLTNLRMSKAKELLLRTDKPIQEIARDVGYEDEFYFSRRFKKISGSAPTVFTSKSDMRVVSLSFPCTDHLHALGIVPSAAQLHPSLPLDTVSLRLPRHAVEPWKIGRQPFVDARPDLILCKDNVLPRAKGSINDIAPVLAISWVKKDVYAHLRDIAELVNRRREAEQWLDLHERRSETLRAEVKNAVGRSTVAICVVLGERLRIYGARNIGHVFYRSLRLSPPNLVAERLKLHPEGTVHNWIAISEDELRDYESDFLFFAVGDEKDKQKTRRLLRSNPYWKAHPAVRSGRVGFLDWDRWMVYAPTLLNVQLEAAARLLTGRQPLARPL